MTFFSDDGWIFIVTEVGNILTLSHLALIRNNVLNNGSLCNQKRSKRNPKKSPNPLIVKTAA